MPKKINIPSLLNFVRHTSDDSDEVCKSLVKLVRYKPNVSYAHMNKFVYDLFSGVSLETVLKAVERYSDKQRDQYIDALKKVHEYLTRQRVERCYKVPGVSWSAARDLQIPFHPAVMFWDGECLVLPVFVFWKINPMRRDREKLGLLASIIFELKATYPDFEHARVELVDLSAPKKNAPREVMVTNLADVIPLEPDHLAARLSAFVEGRDLAHAEISTVPPTDRSEHKNDTLH